MLRIRLAMTLLAALAPAAAACGGEADTAGDQQPEAEAAVTTLGGSNDASEDDAEAASSDALDDAGPSDDLPSDDLSSDAGPDAPPVDAAALLASATTALDGRSVRGEATFELAPGLELSSSFESAAEGDLASVVEVPPGMDPEFPGGAEVEMRYVGGVAYLRPPVTADDLAALGLDEAWYVAEPAAAGDPAAQDMGSAGLMCVFPQTLVEAFEECDPLGDAGAFLEAASEPEIVGQEGVRGVQTTRVRFVVSLMGLVGEAMGMAPGDGEAETSEGGVFDDSASDPFAEGFEQVLGFLDDAGFEVEVWIDDDSLIRRLAFDLASIFAGLAGADAGAETPSSLITVEFYDFDADIRVDAPPPGTIVDRDLLMGGDGYGAAGGEPG